MTHGLDDTRALTSLVRACHAPRGRVAQMSAGVSERAHATSLISMMKNSFEFEYVSVRASFMSRPVRAIVDDAWDAPHSPPTPASLGLSSSVSRGAVQSAYAAAA